MSSAALNKAGLMDLVCRAERGVLLPGEAQILREAIELLDDMAMTLETIAKNGDAVIEVRPEYDASNTGTFRAVCMCTTAGECGHCWEKRQPPFDDNVTERP